MKFSEKIQAYFEKKGLTNRDVSNIMGGYSESMISKYVNSDKISSTFIEKLLEFFPDIDFNSLLKDEAVTDKVEKSRLENQKKSARLIEEIEERLKELKGIVTQ